MITAIELRKQHRRRVRVTTVRQVDSRRQLSLGAAGSDVFEAALERPPPFRLSYAVAKTTVGTSRTRRAPTVTTRDVLFGAGGRGGRNATVRIAVTFGHDRSFVLHARPPGRVAADETVRHGAFSE